MSQCILALSKAKVKEGQASSFLVCDPMREPTKQKKVFFQTVIGISKSSPQRRIYKVFAGLACHKVPAKSKK